MAALRESSAPEGERLQRDRAASPPTDTVCAAQAGTAAAHGASVAHGAFLLLLVQPVTWCASLLGVVLIPHLLSGRVVGQYALAAAIAALAGTVVSLGVPEILVRRLATRAGSVHTDGGAALSLCTSAAIATALVLFFAVPMLSLSIPRGLLAMSLLGVVTGTSGTVLMSLLRGLERHRAYALLTCTTSVTALVSILVLIITRDVVAFVAAGVTVSAIAFLYGWFKTGLALQLRSFPAVRLGELALGGLPFVAMSVTLGVYGSIDNILLGFLSRAEVVGWYGAAYAIISVPVFLPTLVAAPLLPALSRQADDMQVFRQTLTNALIAILCTVVPICALTIAISPDVPTILRWTPGFKNAVPLMQILALHQPLVAVDMLLVVALIALRGERSWLRTTVLLALVNPLCNLILIPVFEMHYQNGAIGASIATVGTEILSCIGAMVLLPRHTVERRIASVAARVGLAGMCLWLIVVSLRTTTLPGAVIAGGVVYVGVGVLLRLWKPGDLPLGYRLAREAFDRRLAYKVRSLQQGPLEPGVTGMD